MKKYYFLIIVALILGLVLTGCSLLSNISQVPATEQSGITYLTKNGLFSDIVGLWRFDEEEGDTAYDSSGNNNYGTLTNMDTANCWVDGKFGNALNFDGVDDYIEVVDSTSLDITGDLTIEAWVKFDSFTYPHSYIVGKDTNGQRSYGLAVDGGHYGSDYIGRVGFVVFKASGAPSIHWGNTVLSTGQWYYIAATYNFVTDGTSVMTIYVDGNPDSSAKTNAVGPIYSGSANLQIGARQYGTSRCFVDGTIDEVRIYDCALSPSTIEAHAAGIYGFNGLMAPYAPPEQKAFKAGSTIPLKWKYTDSAGPVASENADPVVGWIFMGPTENGSGILVEEDAPGASGLRYDDLTMTWQFNWQTDKSFPTGQYDIYIKSNQTGQTDGPFPIQLK